VPSPVPLIFLAFFLVWLKAFFQASAQKPTRGIYSVVTLPYLTLPFLFLSELMDLFVAGRDQSAADQPNNLAEGHPPL
jgi:hypothetical protein